MRKIYLLFMLVSISVLSFGQSVSGTVQTEDGPAIGAIAKLQNTSYGAVTDLDGSFVISNIKPGSYVLEISSVGYTTYTQAISIGESEDLQLGELTLSGGSLALQGVEIIADVAIDRKTPVAVSNIDGEYIENRTGNQEIGELLTVTPSVYASRQGGGAGDSRIVVRGFDQRNTVYMINGIPVNDMENGWVYWSNWAGVADVARTIQVQRGLGASMLANPSIGGTVNLITKTTDMEAGGSFYAGLGNDLYRKYGLTLSTGNMDGWAITVNGSRTTGNGYVGGNFIDAYSYFGSISKDWKKMSLVLTGLGAPQRHGQRTFAYDLKQYVPYDGATGYESFIKSSKAGDFNSRDISNSIRWNSSWGRTSLAPILGSRENDYINERTNFYHKPQVSLNHYWDASDRLYIASSLYGSWGRGGGSGPYGNIGTYRSAYRTGDAADLINWSAVQAANAQVTNGIGDYNTGENFYFLRGSMNEHDWYGLLSKFIYELNDDMDLTFGVDWRSYKGVHYRKPLEFFGLTGFNERGFADYPDGKIVNTDEAAFGLDDERNKIAYDNDGIVDWLGGFTEYEYSTDQLTFTIGGALSNKSYERVDRQNYAADDPNRTSDRYSFLGYTLKGGASYNVTDNHSFFGNAGYLSVAPVFDIVFPNYNNVDVNPDAENEKTIGFEAGYQYRSSKFGVNLNGYYTNWKDKSFVRSFNNANTNERFYANLSGVEALHKGIEFDASIKPVEKLKFNLMAAFNDWKWKNNVNANIFDDNNQLVDTVSAYMKNLKVGNAPQTQLAIMGDWSPFKQLSLDATYKYFTNYYADFDPVSRSTPSSEGVQALKLPSYGLLDLGATLKFPFREKNELFVRGNVYNVLDELYIADARDDSSLETAAGYFAPGLTWTTTVGIRFAQADPKPKVVEVPMPAEPVNLDSDNDGVIDAADNCPDTPGPIKGCPDADGDGVADADDECVDVPGFATNNGCPEEIVVEETIVEVNPDSDGDGIVDAKDNCPDVAGAITNFGCPQQVTQPQVPTEVIEKLNFIARSVFFKFNSAQLHNDSRAQLDAIADIMRGYPSAEFIIEGHTDNVGSDAYNKTLSAKRAASVVSYLVGKGISSSNLSSIGYGEELPIATNDTEEGRQQNRRVVIKLK